MGGGGEESVYHFCAQISDKYDLLAVSLFGLGSFFTHVVESSQGGDAHIDIGTKFNSSINMRRNAMPIAFALGKMSLSWQGFVGNVRARGFPWSGMSEVEARTAAETLVEFRPQRTDSQSAKQKQIQIVNVNLFSLSFRISLFHTWSRHGRISRMSLFVKK